MIRRATIADLSAMVAWGKDAHARSNYAKVAPYNSVMTRRYLKAAIGQPDQVLFVAMTGGSVTGLLLGVMDTYPFSHVLFATDVLFVADKDGDKLLDAFVEWAEKRGCAIIESAPSQSDRYESVVALFLRKGFERCGGTFRRVLRECK